MRLFELTGPEREGIERQVAQIMDYFLKNVRPSVQALQKYYAQQYPKAYWQAYTKSMEQLTKLYSYLAHDINAYTEAMQKTDPNYRFPVVVMDTIKKQLVTHIKNSSFKPKDIHMAKHATQLQYQDNPGVPTHQQIEGEVKKLVDGLKNSLKRPIKPRGGRKVGGPVVDPNPPKDPVKPVDPKKPGTDLSTDVKLKQLGYDDTAKGEYIPGENPDRTKLDKYGEIIDGEFEYLDPELQAIKLISLKPEKPKLLTNKMPRVGDYIMWKGGRGSSRPGEPNYAVIIEPEYAGVDLNKYVPYQSINTQPNKSRMGRKSVISKDKILKYLTKDELQKMMPQQDPKKYRGSGGSGGSGGGSDPLQLPKAVFNKSGTRQGMSQGSKRTQIQKGVNIPPTVPGGDQAPKLNRSGNRIGMSKGSRLNQIRKGTNLPPSMGGTPDNPFAQPSADKVQNAIKKGMANVRKLKNLK